MARYETAAQAINTAAVEVGLVAVTDPYASTDPAFTQLCGLLTSCGRELITMKEWQRLTTKFQFTTAILDTGDYDFPADFGRMIDQTGWNPTARLPLGGPLSAQDWVYLRSTNLAADTIYLSYREESGQFRILPQPPPVGQVIVLEYISRYWVAAAGFPTILAKDAPTRSDDIVLFEPILIAKFLKLRFLESKGFDTTAASKQFDNALEAWAGNDKSAPTLNVARSRSFPYLDDRNVPETGYGLP